MQTEKKVIDLFSEINMEERVKSFKTAIKNILDMAHDLTYTDLDDLSDTEYYNLVKRFYNIYFTEKDYLKILNRRNHKEYRLMDFKTNMTYTDYIKEKSGSTTDYWKGLYQRSQLAAVSQNVELEANDIFPVVLLKNFITTMDIILIKETDKEIEEDLDFSSEEAQNLPLIPFYELEASAMKPEGTDFHFFISKLRKKITKKKILADIKKLLLELQNDIQAFLNDPNFPQAYEEERKEIREWYKGAIEKQKMTRILQKCKL